MGSTENEHIKDIMESRFSLYFDDEEIKTMWALDNNDDITFNEFREELFERFVNGEFGE